MKNLIYLLCALTLGLTMQSCSSVAVGGDEEAVLVMQPWFFGHGGVDNTPVTAGQTWVAPSTDAVIYKTSPVMYTEMFENLIPSDNTPVSFGVYIKVQLHKGESPTVQSKFGPDWYAHNLQAPFRTMVRDKASAFKMLELSSKREVSLKLQTELLAQVQVYVKGVGLPYEVMEVSIGSITPPAEVLAETKQTAAQNQSILTQTSRKLAEDSRKAAEESRAAADQAYMQKMNMSVDQYLTSRSIEVNREIADAVKDGKSASISVILGGNVQNTHNVK